MVLALPVLAGETFADLCPPHAEAIFIGRVTKITPLGATTIAERAAPLLGKSAQRARVWFSVEQSYRGIDTRRQVVSVETQTGVGAAGYDFKIGERYLVYAGGIYKMKTLDYSTLVVRSDSPSKLAAEALQEIRVLDGYREILDSTPGMPLISGRAISRPQPSYPAAAKEARISGVVYIKLVVDETGRVAEAQVVCGQSLLAAAALSAARLARFTPILLSGKPVRFHTVVTYNFVLQ